MKSGFVVEVAVDLTQVIKEKRHYLFVVLAKCAVVEGGTAWYTYEIER